MVINIIGDCDKRPVLYTVMKICQTLGDVLLVSSSSRLMRLSDTNASYGHYQNTMVTVTQEGIDDFFDNFEYDLADFEFVIIDNIISAVHHVLYLGLLLVGGIARIKFKDMLHKHLAGIRTAAERLYNMPAIVCSERL